jgi:glutathione S-transferase
MILMMAESRGILRHISHKYAKQGNPDLIGTGALERASIEQWLQTEAQSFDAPSAEMVYSLALLPPNLPKQQNDNGGSGFSNSSGRERDAMGVGDASTGSKQRAAGGGWPAANQNQSQQKEEEMVRLFEQRKKDLEKLLDIYEQRLEEARYLAGDNFTIADLSHLPNADRLASDPRSRRLFETRKNVSRWWNDVSSRDTWQYVKSLQRPPSTNANANAKDGQHQQQQGQSTDGHNRKNYQQQQQQQQVQHERY